MIRRHAAPLLALALVAAGCSGSSSASHPSRQVPEGTIVVGFPNDLTGNEQEISNGAKIAVREIDGLGGIDGKLKVRLLLRDTGGDAAQAGRVAARLVRRGASVLVLPCDSASQRAIVGATRGKRTILLATCDPDPKLALHARFYWAVGMGANLEAAQLADYAQEQGYRRVDVIPPTGADEYRFVAYFEAAAAARSIQIGHMRPDAILSPVGARETLRLLSRLRRARNPTPLLGTHLLDSPQLLRAGKAAEGTTFTTFGFPDPGFATDEFYEKYKSYYGRRPGGTFSALGYEAIKVLDAVVNRAESFSPGYVSQAFKGLDVQSVLGEIDYGPGGAADPLVRVALVTVENGRFALVKKTAPSPVPPP